MEGHFVGTRIPLEGVKRVSPCFGMTTSTQNNVDHYDVSNMKKNDDLIT
jgi:hypothetical protein